MLTRAKPQVTPREPLKSSLTSGSSAVLDFPLQKVRPNIADLYHVAESCEGPLRDFGVRPKENEK